ncbi:MAG: SGNH/GDSL hydrolase family protein [Oscillospiraceae bacterium]|jgi:lysophospholipase L1-like esterase|nr:SGNH/GDSL hydrolase family protein [Oscillospiraceae bacterium]
MDLYRNVEIFGDSILKGVQLSDENMRYHVDNNIDVDLLEKRFRLSINNFSKFGCTISKAFSLIEKRIKSGKLQCDAIVMNLGGNDCDFDWKAVSERPDDEHQPNTPLDVFFDTYCKIINFLKENGIRPIITTLPPLDAQRFFDWFCGGLEKKANVIKWLGSVESIYRWQENYSRTIEKIAEETGTLLVDLRGAFLKYRKLEHLLCADGTHPNTEGQRVITQEFFDFIERASAKGKIALYI